MEQGTLAGLEVYGTLYGVPTPHLKAEPGELGEIDVSVAVGVELLKHCCCLLQVPKSRGVGGMEHGNLLVRHRAVIGCRLAGKAWCGAVRCGT